MADSAKLVPFEDLFALPLRNGLTRPTAVRGAGVKMINMGEIFAHPRIGNISMERVPLSAEEQDRFLLEPGDLLFARQSLVLSGAGKCSIFVGSSEPITFEGHLIRARLNSNIADSAFYYYFFNSFLGRQAIESIVEQVSAAGIRGSDLAKLRVPYPPLPEQRAIAAILGALDDKIELNRRMNATLAALARALFRSWFVDFDPVRARTAGQAPVGLDPATAALFPAAFADSALGTIPAGWEVKPLGECVTYLSRGVAPSYVENSPIRALNQRAVRWWHIDDTVLKFHDPNKSIRQEAFIRRGDVVINSTGDITIGRGYWFYHDVSQLFADSHVSIIRTSPDILLPELVVFQLETQRHQDIVYGHVTGSTGQLELNRSNLALIPFLCPPIELQRAFSTRVAAGFAKIWNNKMQSLTLAALRDGLLPRLLSGAMRVGAAARVVGAAG